MANLETLELTISANAQSAKGGIDQLITSLGKLSEAITEPFNKLTALNGQLYKLKQYAGTLNVPNVAQSSGASGAVAAAKGSRTTANGTPVSTETALATLNAPKTELAMKKLQGMTAAYVNNARAGKLSSQQMVEQALRIKNATEQYEKLEKATTETSTASEESTSTLAKLKEGFTSATEGIEKAYSRIKRIATTMLIRSAIRGLIKSIKEGITNVREWARVNNHEFFQSMDSLKQKTNEMKNALGASFAPMISALIPLVKSLCNVIIEAANWLNQLISLLTGKSSWIKATNDVEGYEDAVNGAGSAAKSWLATFDELNVMTSSGGGGGGGNNVDYSDMFEEISQFDAKIREIAEFLKSNFESIKAIAEGIGVAILAWKLSNAFAEVLPTLSKLFGYIGTGAIIAVTLQANWLLTNQYLDTGEDGWLWTAALTTAVGATAAAAIAAKLIGGNAGSYAAAITLALAAIADIKANIDHTDVSAFDAKSIKTNIKAALEAGAAAGILLSTAGVAGGWVLFGAGMVALATFAVATVLKLATEDHTTIEWGDYHLSDEEAEEFVKGKMFTINPDTVITLTKDSIKELQIDEDGITKQLTDMMGVLHVVELGLATDDDYKTIKDEITGSGGLIDKINGWINSAESLDKLTLKLMPQLFGSTEEEQQEWYLSDTSGWETVKAFANKIGKELADELVEGEGGQITAKRPERVAKLLEEITRISEIIAGSDISTEAQISLDLGLKDLDSSSFDKAMELYSSYKDQMHDAAEELAQTMIANKTRLVNALKEMIAIDPDNAELQQQLKDAEEALAQLHEDWDDIVDRQTAEWAEPGKNMLQEWVKKNFDLNSLEAPWDESTIRQWLTNDGMTFAEVLSQVFSENGFDMEVIDINDLLEVGGWDLLTADMKKKLISAVGTLDDPSVLNELKGLNIPINDIITFSGFDSFSLEDKNKMILALTEVFDVDEIKKAIPNLGEIYGQAMGSGDPEVQKAAQKWNQIINGELDGDHKVTLKSGWVKSFEPATLVSNAIKSVNNTLINFVSGFASGKTPQDTWNNTTKNWNPTVKIGSEMKGGADNILKLANKGVKTANKKANKVTVKTGWASGCKPSDLASEISKQKPEITVNASLASGFVSSLTTGITTAVGKGLKNVKVNIKTKNSGGEVTAELQANGGFVDQGQLFIAREAGAEMVGTIGTHTAVANNDQIVEGIANGVASANAEQNALLRQQNQILMGILQKSGNVTIGASSALGRVVSQSLNMYGNMVGV